eukprot:gene5922-5991_t
MAVTIPPAETAFLLHEIIGFDAMAPEETLAVLEEATRTAEGILAPLDWPGDRHGSRLENGRVVSPPGFADAFRTYAEAGWIGIAASPDHGGQGLSHVLALAAFEPVSSANMAFGLCPMLTQDAIALLQTHGTPDQQTRLMTPMIAGDWTGTMCLTEPQSGSDLSGVRTRATPAEGGYAITGQKIYITWGEHELAGNILHMVLARLPDAPAGSAGISLFAVPKFLADGTRNGVHCVSLEHKLGIHASPTCVMQFEGAIGELVGPPHRGLPCMFAMMNAARLGVAMQGVAVAERAFRRAADFARIRTQGGGPIIDHPDVRRMLWTMRALALGGRLLTLYAASADEARAQLLIPVAKAWCTDAGLEAASLGVQVHGGMGFVEETGAAQHLRDARILPIYEGTNGIQAITLVRRGLQRDQGAAVASLLTEIEAADNAGLSEAATKAKAAAETLRQSDARQSEAHANAFLQLIGTLTATWLCTKVLANPNTSATTRAAAETFTTEIFPRTATQTALLHQSNQSITGTAAID